MWLEFTFAVPKMTFPLYTTGLICEQLKVATAWKQTKHYSSQISPMAEEQGKQGLTDGCFMSGCTSPVLNEQSGAPLQRRER